MSVKTQSTNMRRLYELLSQDLGYIFGEREAGPNGAKKEFLNKGAAFIRALAKDLGFTDYRVNVNKAGIAVSGEVYLYGMWSEGNGIFIELSQMSIKDACIMYRTICDIRGSKCGRNQFLFTSELAGGNYKALLDTFRALRKRDEASDKAA